MPIPSAKKTLIKPFKKTGMIQNYIKTYIDASPAVVQGMAYTVAVKGQMFNRILHRNVIK